MRAGVGWFKVLLVINASTRQFDSAWCVLADLSERILIAALQHSIEGLWLRATLTGFTPACQQTISSPHVHRFVTAVPSP